MRLPPRHLVTAAAASLAAAALYFYAPNIWPLLPKGAVTLYPQPHPPSTTITQPSAAQPPTRTSPYHPAQLSARLTPLTLQQLQGILSEILLLISQHPESTAEILQLYATALNTLDRPASLDFLTTINHPAATSLAHTFTQDWFRKDQPSLHTHLLKLATKDTGNEHSLHTLIGHLLYDPQGHLIPRDWIAWAHTLQSNPAIDAGLQGAVFQALLTKTDPTTDPTTFQRLKTAYTSRFREETFQRYIPTYTETIAKHEPTTVKDMLEQVPGGLYREYALEHAMAELGRSHPEVAAEWLSSPDAADSVFSPNDELVTTFNEGLQGEEREEFRAMVRNGQNEMFDRAVTRYVESLAASHPEDALASAAALRDPTQRAALTKMVQNLINIRNKAPSKPVITAP